MYKTKTRLAKVANSIYIVFLYAILVVVYTNMVQSSFIAVLLLPIVMLGIYRLARWSGTWSNRLSYDRIWYILFLLFVLFLFWVTYQLNVIDFSWDCGKLLQTAYDYVKTGDVLDKEYYARYPNNRFWLCCLILVFNVTKIIYPSAEAEDYHNVSIAISCIMVALTIFIIHKTAGLIWGSKKAFGVGVITILCAPFYMYASFAYTDTSGMLLCSLFLYLFVKVQKAENMCQILPWCGIGILAAVSWYLKVTVFIIFIAIAISGILLTHNWKKLLLVIFILALFFGGSKFAIDKGINYFVRISDEAYEMYEFPPTHWLMMSLVYGGYVESDVQFTKQFPTYKEKQKANIEEIKKRVEEKGVTGLIKYISYYKLLRTWGDGKLAADDYLRRSPREPNNFFQHLMWKDESFNWLFSIYCSVYYGVMLMGLFLSGLGNWKKKMDKQPLLFVRIAIVGIIIFLSIWECTARYLVAYLPLFMLLAGEGYFFLREFCLKRRKEFYCGSRDTM